MITFEQHRQTLDRIQKSNAEQARRFAAALVENLGFTEKEAALLAIALPPGRIAGYLHTMQNEKEGRTRHDR